MVKLRLSADKLVGKLLCSKSLYLTQTADSNPWNPTPPFFQKLDPIDPGAFVVIFRNQILAEKSDVRTGWLEQVKHMVSQKKANDRFK